MLLLLCLSPAALVAPTKLVVLQHGLYGAAVNMAVLQQELERLGGTEVRAHPRRCHRPPPLPVASRDARAPCA